MSEKIDVPSHKSDIEQRILNPLNQDPGKVHAYIFEYVDRNEANPATFTLKIEIKAGENPYAIVEMIHGGGNPGKALEAMVADYTFFAISVIQNKKIPVHLFYSTERGAKVSEHTASILQYSYPGGSFESLLKLDLHNVYTYNVGEDSIFITISLAQTYLGLTKVNNLGVRLPPTVIDQKKNEIRGFLEEN